MKKDFNRREIEKHVRAIIELLYDDPERDGLKRTPYRVAKAYSEIFEGMRYTNDEIAEMYDVCFDTDSGDLVTECDIRTYSECEHHILPMTLDVSIGYIPNGKVIGLSKMARVADMCSKRLQLQEKIGCDIADVMQKILNTKDIIVYIEGRHMCMDMRGVKKPGTITRTACLRGAFRENVALRSEFYSIVKGQ